MQDKIVVRGARQHNLKNIDVEIPKNKFVVFTGISGSGKSSLAFDTIYAEGQRRYVESLSSYARQFLGIMGKPDVDTIEGLSPAISIEQKTVSHNPRSTVGTVTEIYDYLRLLFARIGHPHCPICGREIAQQSQDQIVDNILNLVKRYTEKSFIAKFLIFSPVIRDKKGEFGNLFKNLQAKGYTKVRIDGKIFGLTDDIVLIKTNKHSIDVVIDQILVEKKDFKNIVAVDNLRSRTANSVEQALSLSDGLVTLSFVQDKSFNISDKPENFNDHIFSEKFSCPIDNLSLPEIEPRTFSFNSPHGACRSCTGLGIVLKVNPEKILNNNLTIAEGGILPLSSMFEHDTWYSRIVKKVAEENGFSIHTQIRNIKNEQKQVLLFGTGDRAYEIQGTNRFGKLTSIIETFPGVVTELERKYTESDSEYTKTEIRKYMFEDLCPECNGMRLKPEALSVTVDGKSIIDVTKMPILGSLDFAKKLLGNTSLSPREKEISGIILKEIILRLQFLVSVGLDYLTLDRAAGTLSGGEAQRIRLASQIGSGLTGVLYVLDEPTIGLHQRDNKKLIATLKNLRELGNTVLVVEHDREMITSSDWILDFGPGAGKEGGAVVAQGTAADIIRSQNSLTGKYLTGKKDLWIRRNRKQVTSGKKITLQGASEHNLKNIDVEFPLGRFICVTGVSGSGKSTLLVDTLYPALKKSLGTSIYENSGKYKKNDGFENINRVSLIDQSPIGRTPRSNPATYTTVFSDIRILFAQSSEAKIRGYKPGRFSFNLAGGRCEACEGQGVNKIEMQFLSDIYVTCDVCSGARYNRETLEVTWHGKNIAEVLRMTVDEAREFFSNIPAISEKLQTLQDVGLGYIELGQSAPTLSGGEAQRIKLAAELGKRSGGATFYILDEPTTGLHFADIEKLLTAFFRLVDKGNTVVVIEHNLDVIKNADWIIDLGPEGGDNGGEIITKGTPQHIAKIKNSYTGQFLAQTLK